MASRLLVSYDRGRRADRGDEGSILSVIAQELPFIRCLSDKTCRQLLYTSLFWNFFDLVQYFLFDYIRQLCNGRRLKQSA
jgi:hypothetical protein